MVSRITHPSNRATLSIGGLILTAAGMLLQIAAGSTLYPSLAGPVVLIAAATVVAFGPRRWTPYVALVVPLVLGVGAVVAAAMTGDFIDQLTDIGTIGILVGSLLHVVGLAAALAGAVGMLVARRGAAGLER